MQPDNVNYGLVGYPVLQTADIVLYKADTVPVGEDQLPHLELAREIVRRFNNIYGPTFPEPHAYLTQFPMVLGLDGVQKMSKSYDNDIGLSATSEETRRLVMTMVTDPARQYRKDPGHPEICNVWKLHRFFKPEWAEEEARLCRTAQIGCVDDKKILVESINKTLEPFRQARADFGAKPALITELIDSGAKRARAIARETIGEVKEKMRLLPGHVHA